MSAAKRLAHTSRSWEIRNTYEERDMRAAITSGTAGVSLGLSYASEFHGITGNLTPAEAREIACELVARADEIDPDGAAAGRPR